MEEGDPALFDKNFSAAKYVKDELSGVRHGDQIERLQELRTWADAIKAATTEELKKSIFAKYHQFMESSKEVAHLEHEMHQLSSLLAAQKTLIENLREMCGDHR
ncbi:hypothetical protein QR680_007835 [Steinernema hermaphroditum]|uniref:Uncharacterized protein n=1 Tax=Steinernema hermaphroditum TaxID=289476 RepID=A0AA39M5Z0_9BILA|nr:hypothetical protein QR680_007835 [Steinernema hermaphroditum]